MISPVADWRRACSRSSTTGGTSSSGLSIPTFTAGDHQPAAVSDGDRHPYAARAADDDPRDQCARQGQARRPGARRCRRFPPGPGQKCGAVDPTANLGGDPVARLPGLPQRTPPPGAPTARAKLMQPEREQSLIAHISDRPTAVSRLNGIVLRMRGPPSATRSTGHGVVGVARRRTTPWRARIPW